MYTFVHTLPKDMHKYVYTLLKDPREGCAVRGGTCFAPNFMSRLFFNCVPMQISLGTKDKITYFCKIIYWLSALCCKPREKYMYGFAPICT